MNNIKNILKVAVFLERRCHYGHAGIKEPDLPRRKSGYRVQKGRIECPESCL